VTTGSESASTGDGRTASDPMAGRVARWREIREHGVPLMFIDSILPGHYRMNYAVIGDTASENPDFKPVLTTPHRFQIGIFEAPPGNGPAWHTHAYVEMFMPLTGKWRFCYGIDEDAPDDLLGEEILEPWDVISFPPGLWRSFENVSDQVSFGFAVLDPHDVFTEKDPVWPGWLVDEAARYGLASDDAGRMVRPDNFEQLELEITERIRGRRDGRADE
jgi:quercetin dioxygenase-like cupin family protein